MENILTKEQKYKVINNSLRNRARWFIPAILATQKVEV
jgi:hypothetical protein